MRADESHSMSDRPRMLSDWLSLLSLLQRRADTGWMALRKDAN